MYHSESQELAGSFLESGRHDVVVDIHSEILARHYNGRATQERNVKALSMFHPTLHGSHQLTVLSEDRYIKVIVVVRDYHFASAVDANPDRVVGEARAPDGAQKSPLVVEDYNSMTTVVTDEYLFGVVDGDTVGKVDTLVDDEPVDDGSRGAEDDDTHHLALDDNDSPEFIYCYSARVLENVRPKSTDEAAMLVVDLDLMSGAPFRDVDFASLHVDRQPIRVHEVALTLSVLPDDRLEVAAPVEHLYSVVVSVGDQNLIQVIHGDAAWLRELARIVPVLAEFAVILHLRPCQKRRTDV